MIDWLSRFGGALNVWLNGIRQANAKAIAAIGLYIGTFIVWAVCAIARIPLDVTAFGLWLGFLAALGGFSMAQFKQERTTDYGYVERQNAGKPTTVNAETATVTGSPVKVDTPPEDKK